MPEVTIDTWSFYSRPFYWFAGLATLLILSGLLWGAYWLRSERKRKAVQAALEHQLSFHQTLFNAMPIPVYVITLKGELDSYNNAFSAFSPSICVKRCIFTVRPASSSRAYLPCDPA